MCVFLKYTLNSYKAGIFLYKQWKLKGFFQFEIIINDLVSSFRFIGIPVLWGYDHYKYVHSFSAGTVFIIYVKTGRLKTVSALKGVTPRSLTVLIMCFGDLFF